jgi:hypothetical protein
MTLIEEVIQIVVNALNALHNKEITPQQFIDGTRIPLKDLILEDSDDPAS